MIQLINSCISNQDVTVVVSSWSHNSCEPDSNAFVLSSRHRPNAKNPTEKFFKRLNCNDYLNQLSIEYQDGSRKLYLVDENDIVHIQDDGVYVNTAKLLAQKQIKIDPNFTGSQVDFATEVAE